jgi:hypothetical protein
LFFCWLASASHRLAGSEAIKNHIGTTARGFAARTTSEATTRLLRSHSLRTLPLAQITDVIAKLSKAARTPGWLTLEAGVADVWSG